MPSGNEYQSIQSSNANTASPAFDWKPEKKSGAMQAGMQTDDFSSVLSDLKKENAPVQQRRLHGADLRKGSGRQPSGDGMEVLAENLAEEGQKEAEQQKEIEELKRKLGVVPKGNAPATETAPAVKEHGHHARWRERTQGKNEEPPVSGTSAAAPSATAETQSELQKMDFKDLLGEGKTKKKKQTASNEEDEESLEGLDTDLNGLSDSEEDDLDAMDENKDALDEAMDKCPNCKKDSAPILFCPQCGTGFCPECAASYKKQGSEDFYTCPKCGTAVKSSE